MAHFLSRNAEGMKRHTVKLLSSPHYKVIRVRLVEPIGGQWQEPNANCQFQPVAWKGRRGEQLVLYRIFPKIICAGKCSNADVVLSFSQYKLSLGWFNFFFLKYFSDKMVKTNITAECEQAGFFFFKCPSAGFTLSIGILIWNVYIKQINLTKWHKSWQSVSLLLSLSAVTTRNYPVRVDPTNVHKHKIMVQK